MCDAIIGVYFSLHLQDPWTLGAHVENSPATNWQHCKKYWRVSYVEIFGTKIPQSNPALIENSPATNWQHCKKC